MTTEPEYQLRLYVIGRSSRSQRAIENLQSICANHLEGRYALEVIDLSQHPALAAGDEIVAVPTLVRRLPEPVKQIVGDLSDTARVLVGLQLKSLGSEPE